MYLITLLAIIILISNSAFCYLSNGNLDVSVMPKMVNFPLDETAEFEENDRSVYDPGVDQSIINIPVSLADPNIRNSEEIGRLDNNLLSLDNRFNSNDEHDAILNKLKEDIKEEEDIAMKSALLLQLLETSTFGSPLPLVYIEDQPSQTIDNDALYSTEKRSGRYYRRYPWKRQNNKYRAYEADARYLCVPSRDEVFKLLIGLHENRNGNQQRTVSFCNRKRPAKAIFTNIRFLG